MAQAKILGMANPSPPKNVGISQAEKDALGTFIITVSEQLDTMIDFLNALGYRITRLEEKTGVGFPTEDELVTEEETDPAAEEVELPEELQDAVEAELAEETPTRAPDFGPGAPAH